MVALTAEQRARHAEFQSFVDTHVAPHADRFDAAGALPSELLSQMAEAGLFAEFVPAAYGGSGSDMLTKGLLCEQIGRGSASLLSLVTVHGMVATILEKWGSEAQKDAWLPKLAEGSARGAFALTEPDIGSDARNVRSQAVKQSDGSWILNGQKKWISAACGADVYVVFCRASGEGVSQGFGGGASAFLVPADTPGLTVTPMEGLMGFRSAMIATMEFDNCPLPEEAVIGRVGFGFSHVGSAGLDQGRFAIAWGCVGLMQGCIDASLSYAREREQFGVKLMEHQLIQAMIADMLTDCRAARAVCAAAGGRKAQGDPGAIMEIAIAKQFAARAAVKAAADAVQIHGGNGCGPDYPVQRYFRDAKIMEIIEGSTQIQQMIIAKHAADADPFGVVPEPVSATPEAAQ